ncbi:IclR family transcriptional regulator [Bacillota bacterium Meth-B3]
MIQSLDRAIRILSHIAERNSLGVTELSQMLSVNKSTVSRLLDTLRAHDMVQIDKGTGKYRLGFRILHLGESLKNSLNVIAIARPIILDLSCRLGESVHLCAFNNNCVYVVDQVRSSRAYSLSATVGMIEPFHCSSVGKCILAYRRPETLRALLAGYEFTRYTEHTITDEDTLMSHLEQIRRQGYAIDDEEMSIGVRCVAVPVFNYRNSVYYSIGISGPKHTVRASDLEKSIRLMMDAAKEVSAGIGCPSGSTGLTERE